MTTVNNKRENEKQDDAKETPIPSTPVRVRLHVAPTFSVVSGSAVSLSRPSPSPSLSDEDEHSPYMLRIHEEEQLQHHHTSSATLSQHPIPALTYSQVSGVELGLLPSHPNTNNNNGMNEEKEQKSLNDTLDEEEDGGETAYTDDTSYVYANDNNYDPHHVIDPNRIVVSSTAATETETNGSALYPLPTAVVDGAVTIRKYSVSHSGIPSSLRRIPSFYHQTFSGLPNDLLSLCMEYLTSRELCVIARVNQRCQQLSCMNKLWSVRCGFMQNADVASLLSFQWVLHNRPRLKDRFLLYRAWKIAKLETEWEQDRRLFQQRKIMCCLHWLDGYAFAGVLLLCFLIGVILLSVQLQSNHGSHIDIGTVTPFFVLVGYIFCVFICVCIARIDHLRPTGTAHKCCHPLSYPDPDRNGIIRNFFQNTLQDHTQQIILVSIMFLLACLWVILFLLRITEVITWSYPLVFIPLFFDFILIFFVCFHPLVLRSPWKNRMALFAWIWILIAGPLFAFLLLLCLRLEAGWLINHGDHISSSSPLPWMAVMIPLFILNAYVCCVGVLLSLDYRSIRWCIGFLWCWGPILAFEVLLAHFLDTNGWQYGVADGTTRIDQVYQIEIGGNGTVISPRWVTTMDSNGTLHTDLVGNMTTEVVSVIGMASASNPSFSYVLIPLWLILSICLVGFLPICLCQQSETVRLDILCAKKPTPPTVMI